jgi:hypothetical protein
MARSSTRTATARQPGANPIECSPPRSSEQIDDLVSNRVTAAEPVAAQPTIITPQADHWLVAPTGCRRSILDAGAPGHYPRIGIVTYREMAECLG